MEAVSHVDVTKVEDRLSILYFLEWVGYSISGTFNVLVNFAVITTHADMGVVALGAMTNGEAICESESAYIYCFKRKNSSLAFSISLGLTIRLCGRILAGRLSANVSLMGGIPFIPDQTLGTN